MARDLQQEAAPQSDALNGTGSWNEAVSVEAFTGADAVLVLTEWQLYRERIGRSRQTDARQPGFLMPGLSPIPSKSKPQASAWRVGDGEA